MKTTTIYRKSVKAPSEFNVLKKGSSNKKLGFKVTSKKWLGSRLFSLTLTERATCPTSCHHWEDCYGNNMPFAHRFDVIGLEEKFWQDMLLEHGNLRVFGYTAREFSDPIGQELHLLNLRFSDRWVIRFSRSYESTELGKWFAAEESFEGKCFDCPEQSGKLKDCASCGLCWTVQNTVRFQTH